MYPRVVVNRAHLKENVRVVRALCEKHDIAITGVTKVFGGDPEIARVFTDNGISMLGDSRIENLKNLESLEAEKWLIRPPMLSEAAQVAQYADVSLNSELNTILALDAECQHLKRRHKVVLMADLGDIREGFVNYDELVEVARQVEALQNITLLGIGVNLTCFSFIQSDADKMQQLVSIAKRVEEVVGHPLTIVSGGNSATIDLMLRGGICEGVNNLRLGESLLFGKERAKYRFLPDTYRDVFTLECEIVELKQKPSMPWGEIGVDSYGNRPSFVDIGIRTKAVCALGKQDFDVETSRPIDADIRVLGASSDHLMLDVTDSEQQYRVGDVVTLELGYFSTMRAFTSRYVKKVYLD
ncbi:alanine/ornithine racemase family PLP-dependent enzyme [Oscillospiraceae bacterium LTW-04]|nr:alanine/ornithine racemase family PLP-dependent enzyme [Oscillospiraceae bacterium MB24-C1]